MIIKLCLQCNNEFPARSTDLKRGLVKFCSRKCCFDYRRIHPFLKPKLPNRTCAFCGLTFYRAKLQSKSGLTFCCREHKDLAQRHGGIKEIQPAHYQGKSYRDLALRTLPLCCNRCSYDTHQAALVVHHKDYDRSNNLLENLEILCANCHAIEHWSQ